MGVQGGGGRFSALLLEGLDHYRKGKMLDAVRAWEEAYLLEPTNLRAREFLRSALERIHAVMTRGARELVALNDFSGALELLNKVLDRKPNDKDALQQYEVCEQNLTLMYESKMGAMDARPRTAIPPDEIIWLNLDPRAGFVLAQIDGEGSFEDLYAICGLKRLDTARILCELLEQGVVQVEGREKAVAKRAVPRH